MDKKPLIIHGHFYQPPREHPWTEKIPEQPTAKPFHNWNDRIHKECYEANTNSPYLKGDGTVLKRFNNYEYISFNFGPTLLNWMKTYHPKDFAAIIQGDKNSIKRTGHGNAIAQAYNHTILPLATKQDKECQILWGIEHFTNTFGRAPESMWLPETAINEETIDLLLESGISYVILSPWQAKSYIQEDGTSILLNGGAIPSFEPYEIEGSKGSISAMFYHPDLASEISFGGILHSADVLYQRILSIGKNQQGVVHTATDGEIYGHHFRLGNMCLSALIEKIEHSDHLEMTNYGAYLAKNKPTKKAILLPGEDERGTSWSCAHGVSRWYKDCGCSTGGQDGWNQEWRAPLRKSFDILSSRMEEIQKQEIPKITDTPIHKIIKEYGRVLTGEFTPRNFCIHLGVTDPSQQFTLCTLLDGELHRMYAYTSCGWFFAELTDITSVQNIRHALRAIHLYQPFTEKDLIAELKSNLAEAKSNLPNGASGDAIVDELLEEIREL